MATKITDIKAFQRMLNNAGFGPLVVDGIWGPKTNAAALRYNSYVAAIASGESDLSASTRTQRKMVGPSDYGRQDQSNTGWTPAPRQSAPAGKKRPPIAEPKDTFVIPTEPWYKTTFGMVGIAGAALALLLFFTGGKKSKSRR